MYIHLEIKLFTDNGNGRVRGRGHVSSCNQITFTLTYLENCNDFYD
jgi:hypothetical protein